MAEPHKEVPTETVSETLNRLGEDGFLTGEIGVEPVIDDVFAKRWSRVLAETRRYDPGALREIDGGGGESWRADTDADYAFQALEGGIVLLGPLLPNGRREWVGGYVTVDLAIDAAHQGRGLGAELVLARFLREGELPTWNLDEPSYSRAGAAAHRAAWRLALARPDLVAALEARFSGDGGPALGIGPPR